MSKDTTKSIGRSILHFFSGTAASRVSGLLRDVLMAAKFGVHPSVAALMTAFRLSHLMRRLLGEGALHSVFVPEFEKRRKNDSKEALLFFKDLAFNLLWILLVIVGLGELGLWGILHSGAFSVDSREIAWLSVIILPSLIFVVLFGLNSSLLQCDKKYFISGVAPTAFNSVWIIMVLNFPRHLGPYDLMPYMAVGIVLACFAQWFVTVPGVLRILRCELQWRELFRATLAPPSVKGLLKPFALGITGVAATQVNSALDYIFARSADLSGPAYLWYAMRIHQLPIAFFGVAMAGALLPPLARAVKQESSQDFQQFLSYALKRLLAFVIPCTFGIFLFGPLLLQVIYARGDFGTEALLSTSYCLWGYGIGLLPMILVMTLAPAFYAKQDYKTHSRGAVLSVFCNIALNAVLIFGFNFGAASVAFATSASAVVNAVYLASRLPSRVATFQWRTFIRDMWGVTAVAGSAAVLTAFVSARFFDPSFWEIAQGVRPSLLSASILQQFIAFTGAAGAFVLILYGCAVIMRCKTLLELVHKKREALE